MNLTRHWILTVQICLTLAGASHAQDTKQIKQSTDSSTARAKPGKASREERLVRAAYEKLVSYNKAALFLKNDGTNKRSDPEDEISFSLRDFRTGPIQEILQKRYLDLVTPPTGEVVSLTRGIHTINKGAEEITFEAAWEPGQYASVFDPDWTVADIINLEAAKYYDLGSYASYRVTVKLAGRSRTYQALVLFHNLHKPNETGVPAFWDSIVSDITRVWHETRPAYKPKRALPRTESDSKSPGGLSFAMAVEDEIPVASVEIVPDSNEEPAPVPEGDSLPSDEGSGGSSTSESGSFSKFWLSLDPTEHASGSHGGTANFTASCTREGTSSQRCEVSIGNFEAIETGTLDTLFFIHKGVKDKKTETGFGPAGTNVSCASVAGVAFSSCLMFTDCHVNITVGLTVVVGKADAQVFGGNLWRDGHAVSNTCNLSSGGSTACTTPTFNGSCPAGTTMSSTGMCCTSPTSCSTTFASKCMMYGGEFDFLTCTCSGCATCGGSPILLDVNGDGLALTNATNGVDFDLNVTGTPQRLSWTRENSDDAWLALDRNGNGTIDDGGELFGDFTQQPAVPAKNGFLALAEFDKEVNGGNGDGIIDARDSIFASLRLWQDANHNGTSEPAELHGLDSLHVKALELDFKQAGRQDRYGNEFRYRAKVHDTRDGQIGRWAWDVFLTR